MLLGFFSGGIAVTLGTSLSASSEGNGGDNSRSDIIFQADGDYGKATNDFNTAQGTFVDSGDWVDDKTSFDPTNYEYNITKTSGTTPSGTSIHGDAVTWSTMPSVIDLNWYLTRTSLGTTTCELELQIREIDNVSNIDSITLTITAIKAA